MLLMLALADAIASLPATDFDLAKASPRPESCLGHGNDGIVVCARRRTEDIQRPYSGPDIVEALPKAEVGLLGTARGSLGVRQGAVGGFPSNRVMATISIPF
ncbi:MAG: hypothetical protein V4618_10735 [Pseudomonadota bacterium]